MQLLTVATIFLLATQRTHYNLDVSCRFFFIENLNKAGGETKKW